MFAKLKLKLILGGIIASIGLGFAWWVYALVNERDQLATDLTEERTLHEVTKASVAVLTNRIHEQNGEIDELNKTFARIRREAKKSLEPFRDHDLANLASKKPVLISNRINAASIRRMRWFEELTEAYSEGRSPTRDGETYARAGQAATATMDNYTGPLFCTTAEGYENIAAAMIEFDRYIQQLQERNK